MPSGAEFKLLQPIVEMSGGTAPQICPNISPAVCRVSLCHPSGFPHNPYNGVICNDVIAASGVFTTKELWKYGKGEISTVT